MNTMKILLAVFVSVLLAACGGGGGGSTNNTPSAPGAPTIGAASAGNVQAAVSFSAPADNGGSTITGYIVTSSPGNITATGTSSPIVVTGLSNGTAYSFTVKANNSVGASQASAASNAVTPVASPVTTATAPDAPIIGTATAGNAQASITFAAPANNGGSAITSYTVTSNVGQFATGTASPIVVTGLTNGTAYTFTAIAANAIGNSVASTASNSVTPVVPPTAPGAPTGVVATAGNGNASVGFATPTNTGGSAITGYTVTSSPGNITATGTISPIAVAGLTNGTAYTFTVTANNAVGAGSPSAASTAVTPQAVIPGAPASASATAGNAQASVSYTPPANNGGSAITGYTVTSSPGNITATGTSNPIVVTGLTNGTSYTFTVVANNVAGSGPTITTNAVVPFVVVGTAPNAPTAVSAVVGNAQATVSFTPPVNTGGSVINSYTVTSSGAQTASGAGSPIIVTGLTNGTAYTFTVTATNGVGTSTSSIASTAVTPITIPGAPIIGSAVAGNAQATVSFTPPANNGGGITSYTVTSSGAQTATGAGSPIIVTGLTNGTLYTFAVTATNAAGTSTASVASNAVTPILTSTIASMPFNGTSTIGTQTNFSYTTVGIINQISATGAAAAGVTVFTDATYTVMDANWTCTTGCIASTPVPAGTLLHIGVFNSPGGAFTLNVANITIAPSQGAVGTPQTILAMPYAAGMVGTVANSYYAYTIVAAINQINATSATTSLGVYTDATYTVPNTNWNCSSGITCTAITPVAVGTVLYIMEWNYTGGVGATYTLSVANIVTTPSQGVAGTPLVITMPYTAGMVGTAADSFYSYTTTVANTNLITANAMTGDIDPQVYLDAAFTLLDTNWTCTVNAGTTPDTCTATTPVAAGTVLYVRAVNFAAGAGANFTLSSSVSGVVPPPPPPPVTSYSISGTVTYAGVKAGNVRVMVASSGSPTFIQWSKSIVLTAGSGTFNINGIQNNGSYLVTAEMDAMNTGQPNASNPATTLPVTTTFSGVNVVGVSLSLADPAAPAPVTPTMVSTTSVAAVQPGNGGGFVNFSNPANAAGKEIATSYKVYWGTDAATATTGGGVKTFPATGNNGGPTFIPGLTNGSILYFKVSALVGAVESAATAIVGPVTIGPLAGGNTVTGTVTLPGYTVPATGATLVVGLYNQLTGAIYFSTIPNTTATQAYTITGVPAGTTYANFAAVDLNGNGLIDLGEPSNTNTNLPAMTVAGATVGNITLALKPAATLIAATDYSAQWLNYTLKVRVQDGAKRVVGVTVNSGPNIPVPNDTGAVPNNQGWINFAAVPVVGDSYAFTVFFSDGTSQPMSANVTGVLGVANLPTGLATSAVAVGATTNAPQFSWLAPGTLPTATPFTYMVSVTSPTANWYSNRIPSTQLSALYNFDGFASNPVLTPGTSTWNVTVEDANGNSVGTAPAAY